jgi:hypothetical protein
MEHERETRHGGRRGKVWSRSQIIRFIRDAVAILVEVRVLLAELVFTVAALYACYIAFQILTHRLL